MEYSFDKMIERLKQHKKERKLTNEQLSDLSGVPYGTLNKILGTETKETNISTVIKLANALGVTAEELIFGTESGIKYNITSHERDIIIAYRKLDPHGTKIVDFVLNEEYKRCIKMETDVEIPRAAAARGDDNSTLTKPNAEHLDDFPTMKEE